MSYSNESSPRIPSSRVLKVGGHRRMLIVFSFLLTGGIAREPTSRNELHRSLLGRSRGLQKENQEWESIDFGDKVPIQRTPSVKFRRFIINPPSRHLVCPSGEKWDDRIKQCRVINPRKKKVSWYKKSMLDCIFPMTWC